MENWSESDIENWSESDIEDLIDISYKCELNESRFKKHDESNQIYIPDDDSNYLYIPDDEFTKEDLSRCMKEYYDNKCCLITYNYIREIKPYQIKRLTIDNPAKISYLPPKLKSLTVENVTSLLDFCGKYPKSLRELSINNNNIYVCFIIIN